MGALLDREGAVGVRHLDREGRRLDSGLFGVGDVVHLGRIVVPLRPAQIHPQQYLGVVGGVDPTGLCANVHQCLARVVLPRQQRPDLELVDRGAQPGDFLGGLIPGGLIVLVLGELQQHADVVNPAP